MIFPFTKQEGIDDCGYACLSMLVEYYHHQSVSISSLKLHPQARSYTQAMSVAQLCQLAAQYEIQGEAYEASWYHFAQLKIENPVVAFCKTPEGLTHYVVIFSKVRNYFYVCNPAHTKGEWIPQQDFQEIYNGIVIVSSKNKKWELKGRRWIEALWIITNHTTQFILLILLGVVVNLAIILAQSFLKNYLAVLEHQSTRELFVTIVIFLFINFLRYTLNFGFDFLIQRLYLRDSTWIMSRFWNKISKCPVDTLQKFDTNEWIKKVSDLELLIRLVSIEILHLILELCLIFLSWIFIAMISPWFVFIIIVTNGILFGISFLTTLWTKRLTENFYTSSLGYQRKIMQFIESFRYAKTEKLQNYLIFDLKNSQSEFNSLGNRNYKIYNLINYFEKLFNWIIQAGIYYFAYSKIVSGAVPLANFLFILNLSNYGSAFCGHIINLYSNRTVYERAWSLLTEFKILASNHELIRDKECQTIKQLLLQNINYQINHQIILCDINLTINKWMFLKGPSGCGKTTLLGVIAGLLQNFTGKILINQKSKHEFACRNQIGWIQQSEYIYDGMVIDNLVRFEKYDTKILKDPLVLKLLAVCGLELTKKAIGNAMNFSRGQRQIIAYLSALVENYDVLLIDEGFSNLDAQSKAIALELLKKYYSNKIVVYAGHDNWIEKCFQGQVVDMNVLNSQKK